MTVEELKVLITADNSKFTSILKGTSKQTELLAAGTNKLGTVIHGALAVVGVSSALAFGKSCIGLGSNLSEVQNVVDTTFPRMTQQIEAWSDTAIDRIGLSETTAKNYASTLGAMAQSMGFAESEAYSMATTLTDLTGDVSSFYNLSSSESFNKIKAIFTGETESIKSLGVVMTQAALDEYAMANGWGKVTSQMTEAEKVSLRMEYVTNALSKASGDFEKTSGGWANQTRILQERFNAIKATLGQGFINALTPTIRTVNELMGALQGAADQFRAFTAAIFGEVNSSNNAATVTDAIAGNLSDAATSAQTTAKALFGFDQINTLGPKATSTSGIDTGASDAITDAIQGAAAADASGTALSGFALKCKELLTAIEPFASGVGQGFIDFWAGVKSSIEDVANSELVSTIMTDLTDWLNDLDPETVHDLGVKLGELSALGLGTGLIAALLGPATATKAGVSGLAVLAGWDVGSWISEMTSGTSVSLSEFISEVVHEACDMTLGSNLIGFVTDGFTGFFTEVFDEMQKGTLGQYVSGFFMDWFGIEDDSPLGQAITSFAQIEPSMRATIVATAGHIKNAMYGAYTYIRQKWSDIGMWFGSKLTMIKDKFIYVRDKIKTAMYGAHKYVTDKWSDISTWFGQKLTGVKQKFEETRDKIKSTMLDAYNYVKTKWSSIGTGMVFGIVGAFSSGTIKKTLTDAIVSALNSATTKINAFTKKLNEAMTVTIPGVDILGHHFGGQSLALLTIPQIPQIALARGGITTGATDALIGEHGREAVLPLENNTGWMDIIVSKLTDSMMEILMSGVVSGGARQSAVVQNTIKVGRSTIAQVVRTVQADSDGRFNPVAQF